MKGEIHFRIKIGEANSLWLCGGTHKDALLHSLIYLDKDVDITKYKDDKEKIDQDNVNRGVSTYEYVPSTDRVLWTNKYNKGNECFAVLELPKGNHILSIATDPAHDTHLTKISHIIMWP